LEEAAFREWRTKCAKPVRRAERLLVGAANDRSASEANPASNCRAEFGGSQTAKGRSRQAEAGQKAMLGQISTASEPPRQENKSKADQPDLRHEDRKKVPDSLSRDKRPTVGLQIG